MSAEAESHPAPEAEPDRLPGAKTSVTVLVSIIIGGLSILFAAWLLARDRTEVGPAAPERRGTAPPTPSANGRLERTLIENVASGQEERRRQLEELGRYSLLDRERGVYAIPIDRAIDLAVAKGAVR